MEREDGVVIQNNRVRVLATSRYRALSRLDSKPRAPRMVPGPPGRCSDNLICPGRNSPVLAVKQPARP
jgi:hypothetical protein